VGYIWLTVGVTMGMDLGPKMGLQMGSIWVPIGIHSGPITTEVIFA
jgi:hypothetical protein